MAKTRRKLEMGARVLEFSRMHQDQSASYKAATGRLEELLARADQLGRQEVDGRTDVHAATARKKELRLLIRQAHLTHLTNVARVAAIEEPELLQKFRYPRDATTYRAFQTAAATLAEEAEFRKELLLRHGLSEEVLLGLKVALDQFEAAVEQWSAGRLAHVGANAELDKLADKIVQVVRLMDGLVRIRFANQQETLAAWDSASNVFGPPRSGGETPPDGAPPADGEVESAA